MQIGQGLLPLFFGVPFRSDLFGGVLGHIVRPMLSVSIVGYVVQTVLPMVGCEIL